MTDWTDLGIGRNIAASTNEPEEISETQISERGDTPGNDPTSHIHVSKAANPTPAAGQDNDDAATKLRDYERLSKKSQEHSKLLQM